MPDDEGTESALTAFFDKDAPGEEPETPASVTPAPEIPPAEPAPEPVVPIEPAAEPAAPAPVAPPAEPAPVPAQTEPTVEQRPFEPKPSDWRALRETRRELETQRAENERLRQELQQRQQPAAPPVVAPGAAPAAAPLPDPEPDEFEFPIEHSKWVARNAERRAVEAERRAQQAEQTANQALTGIQRSDFQNEIIRQETAFRAQHSDYDKALEFLASREGRRWEALGVPKEQIGQKVMQRAGEVIREAQAAGIPLANAFYALACEEGWNETMMNPQPAVTPTPAPPARSSTPPVAPTPAQQLAASRARSAVSATSLSSIPPGGPGAGVPRSIKDLESLTQEEMDNLSKIDPGWEDRLTE